MIRDFGSFIRRGLLADLECSAEIWWGQIADRAGRGETGEEMVEDRKTTDLLAVRVREAQRLSLITGDANDPKCLGFHGVKPRKVRGRSTSPKERAVLHQAADESFLCGTYKEFHSLFEVL